MKNNKIIKPIKLHLGCGNIILPGWTNIDIIDRHGVDIVDDITKLTKIHDSSCSIIYACHVLEHISRHNIVQTLSLWNRKLQKNGIIRLSVPDFDKVIQIYLKNKNITEITGFVNGGQKKFYDSHLMIFNIQVLEKLLIQSGFDKIRQWDWKNVSHGKYDDYSQAYLPHMDKENGTLMSLNIEATKSD